MSDFWMEFNELPLSLLPGIEAGLINGRASIAYDHAGSWQIESIEIEGYRKLTLAERDRGIKPWVFVQAPLALSDLITARLNHEWSDKVRDAVREQIERDYEAREDGRADARREHSFV